MNASAIPDSLLQQISNGATRPGDAVSVTMLRKALDLQAVQAAQLIASVAQSLPDPAARIGRHIDIKA
jgi:hypothetical protein